MSVIILIFPPTFNYLIDFLIIASELYSSVPTLLTIIFILFIVYSTGNYSLIKLSFVSIHPHFF